MRIDREAEVLRQNLFQYCFVQYKSHMNWPAIEPKLLQLQSSDWLTELQHDKMYQHFKLQIILYSWGMHSHNNNIWEEIYSGPTENQNVSTTINLNPHSSLVVRDQVSHPYKTFQFWNLTPKFLQSCVSKKYIIIVQSSEVPRLIIRLKRWEYMEYICLFGSVIGSELS
jgi:hypothetical protein